MGVGSGVDGVETGKPIDGHTESETERAVIACQEPDERAINCWWSVAAAGRKQ